MPLTITEQVDIVEGREAPPNANVDLLDIVAQTANVEAKNFIDNYKLFDGTVNIVAQGYKDKMIVLANSAFKGSQSIQRAVISTLITIGAPSTTIIAIQALTQSGWESFVSTNIFTAFEYVAGVTQEEKTAYNAI